VNDVHAPEPVEAAGAQRYTHGWVPVNKAAPAKKATPAPKAPGPSAKSTAAKTARDAKKAANHDARMKDIKAKLAASQSRVQARGALNSANLAELQELAHDLKLSADGDKPALVNRIAYHRHPSLLAAAAADPSKPYGDVTYADPGYQADGKKRYPLDSEDHCRAAWSYINQADNAAKYNPRQLKAIKSRIRAALEKYGVTVAEDVKASGLAVGGPVPDGTTFVVGDRGPEYIAAAAAPMLGVELARPGTWQLSTGKRTFTVQDLKDAADFFEASGQTRIPFGPGHQDSRFDGNPAFGWVSNIRYTEDGKGPVLLGDLVDMDEWLAAAASARWPNRSIEGFANLDWNGRTYALALTRLALLGDTPPAMPTLRSLSDIREAIAAAAATSAAEFITATAMPDQPEEAEGPAETEEPAEELSEQDTPEDPAPEAVVTSREMETGMDPAKFREALGLDDDVSDDDVMEALAVAGFTVPSPAPEGEAVPVAASAAGFVAPPGTILIEASAWNDREERIKRLEAAAQRTRDGERDQIITQAIQEGRFAPSRREHWVRLWNADAEGTRQVLATLARNVVPIAATGYSGENDEELDREYAHLFPPKQKAS
jgi:hypothetical protein